ncbi:hypothetical protein AGMMS49579_14720 [Spirochaetia bacterium]|nr:hypothetical protein AGMMS49579_14720 [Spirochaetia bacterium]
MENNEGRERLAKGIDQLTEENRGYVLRLSEALVFAQEATNRPEDTALGDTAEGRNGHTRLF